MKRDEYTVSNQVLDELKRYVEDLLSFFGLKAAVKISTEKSDPVTNSVTIDIADSELSRLLVGYQGKNLNALRHLISAFSKTKWPDLNLVIYVDIGEYRALQTRKLLDSIDIRAQEILENLEPQEVEGLSSLERRNVHRYISEKYSGKLVTESSGQGSERRLYIKTVN